MGEERRARLSSLVTGAADVSELVLRRAPRGSRIVGQARAVQELAHRPWPPPKGPWLMAQTWEDLLFAHWPVDPSVLRALVPSRIPIDTFDGVGWIGVTPFELRGLRRRGLPPPPVISRFPELNVRTYTTIGGRPGIWFFSLDAASRLAVAGARRVYRLPYFHARMRVKREGRWIRYCSRRTDRDGSPAELILSYASVGAPFHPHPGSLEHFLTERYCLYAIDDRRGLMRAEINHAPWSLRPAMADISTNTMTAPLGIDLPRSASLLHLSRRQDVVIWSPAVID